jgi:hypothetical protein
MRGIVGGLAQKSRKHDLTFSASQLLFTWMAGIYNDWDGGMTSGDDLTRVRVEPRTRGAVTFCDILGRCNVAVSCIIFPLEFLVHLF